MRGRPGVAVAPSWRPATGDGWPGAAGGGRTVLEFSISDTTWGLEGYFGSAMDQKIVDSLHFPKDPSR